MGATSEKQDGVRELLELEVREVSLVDRPAIKREFVIVKRLGDTMGNFAPDSEEIKHALQLLKRLALEHLEPITAAIKKSQEGATAPTAEQLTDLYGQTVESLFMAHSDLAGISKSLKDGGAMDEAKEVEAVEKAVKKAGLPTDLKEAFGKVLPWLKGAGAKFIPEADKDALQMVVAFLGKVGAGGYPYPSPQGKTVQKGEEGQAAGTDAKPVTTPEEVEKASSKRMTNERLTCLKDAISKLSDIVKAFEEPDMTQDHKPVPTTETMSAQLRKMVDDATEPLKKTITGLEKSLKTTEESDKSHSDEVTALKKRLDAVEGTSKGGTEEGKPISKADSIWKGLI